MRDIASIVGLRVISATEGRDLGAVSQVIVDLGPGALRGVLIGKGPSERAIAAEEISVIGPDVIVVASHKAAKHPSELPELMEKRRDPREGSREIVTDAGRKVGVLGTIYINPATKMISRYEVSGGAWRDITEGVVSLNPVPGTVDGKDTIIIPDSAIGARPDSAGGLKAQLARLAEVARQQTQPGNGKPQSQQQTGTEQTSALPKDGTDTSDEI